MTDQVEISRTETGSHTHIRGVYGDGGENESVLSVVVHTAGHPHFPETARIFVGSPKESPLIEGYLAKLGAFSCSAEAAEALIGVLTSAVEDIRRAEDLQRARTKAETP